MRIPLRHPALALAIAVGAAPAARGDEGMWMPQQLPALAARLAERGFEGDPRPFSKLTGQPLGAVVSLGGCSASFVSPDGLIATNHHCVIGALQFNSSADADRLEDGFVARSREEELWSGPGSRVYVAVEVRDVTREVTGGIDPRLDDLARGRLIEKRVRKQTALCEREGGVRCTVAPFFDGLTYQAIRELEIQDVRLVYAPPELAGRYGGETDNWAWPRHSGDFALLRAYVGRNGRPAPHARDNVPYRPPRHLRVSPAGASQGELVLVAGYPGRTYRLRTAAEVKDTIEWSYPLLVRRYRDRLAILEQASKRSREARIRLTSLVRQHANYLKKWQSVIEVARSGGLLAKKAAEEADLAAWIEGDPARRAEFGDVLQRLDALRAEEARTRERDAAYVGLYAEGAKVYGTRYNSLLSAARAIWRLAEEKAKPDAERDPEFQERNWPQLREVQLRLERTLELGADRALLAYAILEAAALPAGQRIEPLDELVGLAPGQDGSEVHARVDAYLDSLYGATRLADTAVRLSLLGKGTRELRRRDEPFLRLAQSLATLERRMEDERYARDGARSRVGPRHARALIQHANGLLAPDANSTLRVGYGLVKGMPARDGIYYTPQTTISGIAEKHRPGDPEFEVPASLLKAIRAQEGREKGPFVDPKLGDVPVAFLADLDISNGSSGSPVMNGKGELVGLLFDGTLETITSDFEFDPARTRSIGVDVRYLLWTLQEIARANHLLEELGVRSTGAASD